MKAFILVSFIIAIICVVVARPSKEQQKEDGYAFKTKHELPLKKYKKSTEGFSNGISQNGQGGQGGQGSQRQGRGQGLGSFSNGGQGNQGQQRGGQLQQGGFGQFDEFSQGGLEQFGQGDFEDGSNSIDEKNYFDYPKYKFAYGVKDPHTGDLKEAWEHRDGDVVVGEYMLLQPDGKKRIVKYHASDKEGFNAVVKMIGKNGEILEEFNSLSNGQGSQGGQGGQGFQQEEEFEQLLQGGQQGGFGQGGQQNGFSQGGQGGVSYQKVQKSN